MSERERQERVKDMRPANCRFRLQDEGKAYPRSMCTACGATITTGLGKQCTRTEPPTPAEPNPPGSGDCPFCRTLPGAGETACTSEAQAQDCAWFDSVQFRAKHGKSPEELSAWRQWLGTPDKAISQFGAFCAGYSAARSAAPLPSPSEGAGEWQLTPHILLRTDEDVLRRQRERLDAMSESWIEEARQYSVEGDHAGDLAMMTLARIFTRAANAITYIIKEADALRTRATATGGGGA